MPLSSGDKLDPYEMLAPIGAGGMGEIYRAKDTKLDREVAIKVSSRGVEGNALVMELIEGEALKCPAVSGQ
jgi:serine/threonine protein kinase